MNGDASTMAVLSLYDALTEIASNEGNECFAAGQPYIGTIAGMSARNVRRLEPLLEEFGLLKIVRPRLRGHNAYTLLSIGHSVPTLGRAQNSDCPPVEVTKEGTQKTKETKETKETKGDSRLKSAASPSSSGSEYPGSHPEWKPAPGTKEQKLMRVRLPADYPSETEFDKFLEEEDLGGISEYRPDLYVDLCRRKWHEWKEDLQKWVPIRNWKPYVSALNDKILPGS